MIHPANRTPLDPKVVQRALDTLASLPFATAATPPKTIEEFAAFFADFARETPLADVATLQGYRPEIIRNLIGAMEWRRCELDNQMAALGAEEVSTHAQLAEHVVSDPLPGEPVADGPATRRLHRLFRTYLRATISVSLAHRGGRRALGPDRRAPPHSPIADADARVPAAVIPRLLAGRRPSSGTRRSACGSRPPRTHAGTVFSIT